MNLCFQVPTMKGPWGSNSVSNWHLLVEGSCQRNLSPLFLKESFQVEYYQGRLFNRTLFLLTPPTCKCTPAAETHPKNPKLESFQLLWAHWAWLKPHFRRTFLLFADCTLSFNGVSSFPTALVPPVLVWNYTRSHLVFDQCWWWHLCWASRGLMSAWALQQPWEDIVKMLHTSCSAFQPAAN